MDYKHTLNLPSTTFPMKGNLPVKEKQILEFWKGIDLYGRLLEQHGSDPTFILHDGPPYANGHIHLGTALNKILKDIIVRSRFMAGFRADYVPGWDCHGLPIETQVEKEIKEKKEVLTKTQVRQYCRQYAERFVAIQKDEFKRLGGLGDWDHPYITMDHEYQATIVEEIAQFFQRGDVYRQKKPVHWCINCTTALAEAEIEYEMKRSASIYVKFPLADREERFQSYPPKPIFMLIWTTTPWTLPANLAIAINPEFTYVAFEVKEEIYFAVKELVEDITQKAGITDYRIIEEIEPEQLRRLHFRHPFIDRPSVVVLADYVAKDVGTGVVHIAPGHGEEDYGTGLEHGMDVYSPVDAHGRFTDDVDFFRGMNVFASNQHVIAKLQELGRLLYTEEIEHSYPHCWRCKKPVIFRATEQWFISLDKNGLRERALAEIDRVKWIPVWGRDRIYGMLQARPDWCISRQRTWGVPITIFYCGKCATPYWSRESFERIIGEVKQHGADIWFEKEAAYFIPEGTTCPACGNGSFVKEEDILDVWFDSGVSQAAVLKKRKELKFPCDMYLEGSDQHRGWFHSSLLVSVGNSGVAPYRSVLTHGFVVDGKGRKMSKSLGNIIAPEEVIQKYGAELLRLWVTYEDYRDDIRISKEIVDRLVETYRRIRNTFRFLHANIFDFNPETDRVTYERLSPLDGWLLSRLQRLIQRVLEAYESYAFNAIYHSIHNFCTVDLSALYLDIVKDRMYVEKKDSVKRRASQTVIFETLLSLVKLTAPILAFTSDEMWSYLKDWVKEESVFLAAFPKVREDLVDAGLEEEWERIWRIREAVNKKLEEKRVEKVIGHPLDAKVILEVPADEYRLLRKFEEEFKDSLIVSQLDMKEGPAQEINIQRAEGEKCQRCWQYSTTIFKEDPYVNICPRCKDILTS